MDFVSIKNYLAYPHTELDEKIPSYLMALKRRAVEMGDEDLANEIWCINQIYIIQNGYLSLFRQLKEKQFEKSWATLEHVNIEIVFLKDNFDYSSPNYGIPFIEKKLIDLEKMYPYEHFFSREAIIKKEKCSICGQVVSIRHNCGHRVGKLYMGELCSRIVIDAEMVGLALVTNPFDKYGFVRLQGKEYNYAELELLSERINSPFDQWHLEIENQIRPEFKHIGRNAPCPCGSGIKYKKCCRGTKKEQMEHHCIVLENGCRNTIPVQYISTWK